jgi:peptidyl-prolyl cis-trans isomerase A (cyclophilin A)
MNKILVLLTLVWAVGCSSYNSSVVEVVIETSQGDIVVEVDTVAAPITGANFLRYVDAGMYSGGSFFRVVTPDNQPQDSIRIEVIQGGANPDFRADFFDDIPLERTSETGLLHEDGTISMARGLPDSGNHSFFICIGAQPSLDFGGMRNPDGQGFAAFGKVTEGMDIVKMIQSGEVADQMLVQPVAILGAHRN